MNMGAAKPESDSSTVPTSGSVSREVAARLATMINARQASAKAPGAQSSPPARYGAVGQGEQWAQDGTPHSTAEGLASISFPQPAWLKNGPPHGVAAPPKSGAANSAEMLQALVCGCCVWCITAGTFRHHQVNMPREQVQALLSSDANAALALLSAKMQRGSDAA